MYLNEMRQKGIFKRRFYIGDAVGEEKEAVWLELRGPTSEEMIALSQVKEDERGTAIIALMETLIVDHNIETDDGVAATNAELYAFIAEMPEVHTEISTTLMEEVPLAKKSKERSDKSVSSASPVETPEG